MQTQPAEGLAVAAEKGVTVGIDTAFTPQLEQEGHARELVRHIQHLRKDGTSATASPSTSLADTPLVRSVLDGFGDYVQAETLTTELRSNGVVVDDVASTSFVLGGEEVTVGVERV